LFVVLVILANLVVAGLIKGGVSAAELQSTFYLAFFIHVGFSLYDGSFDGRRTVTWLLLIVAWFGAELAGFLGYVLLWGQITLWLASMVSNVLPSPFAEKFFELFAGGRQPGLFAAWPVTWPGLLLLFLAIDLAVMHWERWRGRPLVQLGMFLATAVAAALLLGFVAAALVGHSTTGVPDSGAYPTPAHILPAWNALPFYALLRAIPNKLAGIVLAFAAMAVPLIWPWMRADDLRVGPVRKVWLLLCLTQAAVWIGLGYLGSLPPKPPEIYIAQALAVAYLAFFLVWPPLLHRVARQR
jgi:quinol-cytochrome oxidoreductase complex cytochrome b subunit